MSRNARLAGKRLRHTPKDNAEGGGDSVRYQFSPLDLAESKTAQRNIGPGVRSAAEESAVGG